ncbi:hypothetical protein [Streptomyces violascens]|uniref:TraA n=1 Tax=Streptomyces violascens TaxID=67381 RepID=A0ABQ3QL67_9ACTN|nr:hypothetical protein [Streptomyces violascens]GGU44590.1 hypothetical protein GCM10010289_76470 [Streptomyces violascens]GHI38018.1 hypothetical protein Sviol_24260 [Streptomyces violascens]
MSTPEQPAGMVIEAVKLEGPAPLRLMTDWEILAREARLARAEEAARGLAQPPQETSHVVQLLAEQGAPPELLDRARAAVQEDRAYAQAQADRAQTQAVRLHDHWEQAEGERTRRLHLPPGQLQAEAAERLRQRAAPRPAENPSAPQQPAVAIPQIQADPRSQRR